MINSMFSGNSTYYFDYLLRTQKFPQSVYHRAKHEMTKKMVAELPAGSVILDAGCGLGNISAPYCRKYKVVGIDEQQEAIDFCKAHYRGRYLKADIYKRLPFKNNYFDLILFHDSIEHFTEPKKALKELSRVLKKGKKILISTINYSNPLWAVLENTWHRVTGGNCRTYSRDVHPTRYTEELLRNHCKRFFKEVSLDKKVLWMELFYTGTKR